MFLEPSWTKEDLENSIKPHIVIFRFLKEYRTDLYDFFIVAPYYLPKSSSQIQLIYKKKWEIGVYLTNFRVNINIKQFAQILIDYRLIQCYKHEGCLLPFRFYICPNSLSRRNTTSYQVVSNDYMMRYFLIFF